MFSLRMHPAIFVSTFINRFLERKDYHERPEQYSEARLHLQPLRPVSTDPILRANELIDNLKLAKDACAFAALRGCDPVAPHLFYPQFLDDNDPTERALGMELGLKALRACDELWIISPRISNGMSAEIKEAQKCGIRVLVFTAEGFREYRGTGDMTDNCNADTADGVID